VAVARLADMSPGKACVVRAGGRDLALVCTADGLFAMDNTCPHSGGPLGEGVVEGNRITCPLHGWQFDCRTGRSLTEKRPPQTLYPVRVDRDQVLLEVPDTAAPPVDVEGPAPCSGMPGSARRCRR
jgi:nitrite reductase/ring-hydroxylating ferredoxin subunit